MADDLVDEIWHHLRDLVAFPTVSTTSNGELQEWLSDRLVALGGRVEIIAGSPGRANLVATVGPEGPGGLLLSGHTDVVPPGDGWATDPWRLTGDDSGEHLVGRGTADMKGFLAASLVALAQIDLDALAAPVHLVASYDEEIGCRGVRDVIPLIAGRDSISPTLALVGEPTMMRPRFAHLGKQVRQVTVRAAEAHSSRASVAPSAITCAAALVGTLAAIQASCPPAGTSDGAPPYSVNCGSIRGGTQPNVIAARCDLELEVRHDVHHDPDELLATFEEAVAAARPALEAVGGGIEQQVVTSYPAMLTDRDDPAFRLAERLADRGPATTVGYGTEGGLLATALAAPIMICGPGDIADAHRANELVAVEQLLQCSRFVRRLVEAFCSPSPAN